MPTRPPRKGFGDEATSTLRGETTVPRRDGLPPQPCALNNVDGNVSDLLGEHDDPVVTAFLDFLSADARANPQSIRPVPEDLVARARELVKGVAIDLDAPLNSEDD